MTFTMEDQKLMPTDCRRRVRVPEERREALLDEFERSGLSGVKFAQLAGVKYPTFALWAQKRRKARQLALNEGASGQSMRFAEAVADRSTGVTIGTAGLTIELPGGARVQVQSPLQLQMVAELLRLVATSGLR
jgi:hypothetical protein